MRNSAFIHNFTNCILTPPFKISIILFPFSKEICADLCLSTTQPNKVERGNVLSIKGKERNI